MKQMEEKITYLRNISNDVLTYAVFTNNKEDKSLNFVSASQYSLFFCSKEKIHCSEIHCEKI